MTTKKSPLPYWSIYALLLSILGFHTQAIASPNHNDAIERLPVLLIPGYTGQAKHMSAMQTNFVQADWDESLVFTWTDSQRMQGDLSIAGQEIGVKIDDILGQTGKSKVVLITWSASTLAGRSYLKNITGAQSKVALYISMAGPHQGTTTWVGCRKSIACQQFAPNSSFLETLNSETEVPGAPGVKYVTYRSKGDINVKPTDSATLKGAENKYAPTNITHFDFPSNPQLFDEILNDIATIKYKIHQQQTSSENNFIADNNPVKNEVTTKQN